MRRLIRVLGASVVSTEGTSREKTGGNGAGAVVGARVWGALNIHLSFIWEGQLLGSQALSGMKVSFISHHLSTMDEGDPSTRHAGALTSRSPSLLVGQPAGSQ